MHCSCRTNDRDYHYEDDNRSFRLCWRGNPVSSILNLLKYIFRIRKEVTTKEYERLEEEKKKAVEKDGKKPPQKYV